MPIMRRKNPTCKSKPIKWEYYGHVSGIFFSIELYLMATLQLIID